MELLQRINENKLVFPVDFLNFKQILITNYWISKCDRFLNSSADPFADWDGLYSSRKTLIIQQRGGLKSQFLRIWFW